MGATYTAGGGGGTAPQERLWWWVSRVTQALAQCPVLVLGLLQALLLYPTTAAQCIAYPHIFLSACCVDAVLGGLQHSKQLLWGWYTLRFYPPDALIEAIAKRLTPLVHNMDARTVSEFIWAFGGLNYEPSNMQLFLQVYLETGSSETDQTE